MLEARVHCPCYVEAVQKKCLYSQYHIRTTYVHALTLYETAGAEDKAKSAERQEQGGAKRDGPVSGHVMHVTCVYSPVCGSK
jgi:hypothetical protein